MSSITIVSTFIVQASFMIITYGRQNMFIIQATGMANLSLYKHCKGCLNLDGLIGHYKNIYRDLLLMTLLMLDCTFK